MESFKAPSQGGDSIKAFSSEVDELESVLDSSNLADTLTEDATSSVFLEEEGAEDSGENPDEYFNRQTVGDADSKIANLSLEEARSEIPKSVLKSLKEQFNGSLEYCRTINQRDRFF